MLLELPRKCNVKNKRITALVILLIVAIMTAAFLNDPPIGKVTTDEISDYFRVNKFVESTIEIV